MKFVYYLVRSLMCFYQNHYGAAEHLKISKNIYMNVHESDSWFFPDTELAVRIILELKSLGYYRDFEIVDFLNLGKDVSKGLFIPLPALAKAIHAEIKNANSLRDFCYIITHRLHQIDPMLHYWSEIMNGKLRIYYDFSASAVINFVPAYPFLRLCQELQQIFELNESNLTIAIREDSMHNYEMYKTFVPFRIDTTKGHSYAQFEVASHLVPARFHNPLLKDIYREITDELMERYRGGNSFVEKITRIVEHNLGECGKLIDAEAVAALFTMSPATFYRRLQDSGVTYGDICVSVRLLKAEKLLKQNNLSVKDIAIALGFSGIPAFSRFFKEKRGMSPSSHRVRNRLSKKFETKNG